MVHPYAWNRVGTSSESLLGLLCGCGYQVFDMERQEIGQVDHYGEIIALPSETLG